MPEKNEKVTPKPIDIGEYHQLGCIGPGDCGHARS